MQRKFLLAAYIFICANSFAQQYPFVHYTPKDGLVNNRARFIFQDSKGRLYISTFGGLSVYDGSRFTNYITDNGLTTSLVNDIVEMGEDSFWIIPNGNKLHCLVNGKITNISSGASLPERSQAGLALAAPPHLRSRNYCIFIVWQSKGRYHTIAAISSLLLPVTNGYNYYLLQMGITWCTIGLII
jgi:hypothetical protein